MLTQLQDWVDVGTGTVTLSSQICKRQIPNFQTTYDSICNHLPSYPLNRHKISEHFFDTIVKAHRNLVLMCNVNYLVCNEVARLTSVRMLVRMWWPMMLISPLWTVLEGYHAIQGALLRCLQRMPSVSAQKWTSSMEFPLFSASNSFSSVQTMWLSQCPHRTIPCFPHSIKILSNDLITFWFSSILFWVSLLSCVSTASGGCSNWATNSLILVIAVMWYSSIVCASIFSHLSIQDLKGLVTNYPGVYPPTFSGEDTGTAECTIHIFAVVKPWILCYPCWLKLSNATDAWVWVCG